MESGIGFLVGIGLLLVSTQFLVRYAVKVAYAVKLSPLIVGVTVVAVGTSLPELVVSVVAALRGDVGLAWGNIVGSNIANVLLVFPVGILVGKLRVGTTKTQRNALLVFLVSMVFVMLSLMGLGGVYVAGILLFGAALISVVEVRWAVLGRKHEDLLWIKNGHKKKLGIGGLMVILASVIGVVAGGLLLVGAVEELALISGITTTVLGLSLTAVATSLPELLTTIFAEEEHQEKVTVGNIVGSNIYNLLLIGGVVVLVGGDLRLPIYDYLWLLGSAAIFLLVLKRFSGRVINKWVGMVLLLVFGAYLLWLARGEIW